MNFEQKESHNNSENSNGRNNKNIIHSNNYTLGSSFRNMQQIENKEEGKGHINAKTNYINEIFEDTLEKKDYQEEELSISNKSSLFNNYPNILSECRNPFGENLNSPSDELFSLLFNNRGNVEDYKEKPTNTVTNEEILIRDDLLSKNKKSINKFKIIIPTKKGRKKKSDSRKGEHDKFNDDNIRRKIKHLVLKNIWDFINIKIKKLYNNNIGRHLNKKNFLIPKGNQKSDASITFNQIFLKKTLSEILSVPISTKYTNFSLDYNEKLVNKLKNEEDEEKKIYFNSFFNLTFLQCLRHYIKIDFVQELNGMKCFDDEKIDDEEYKNELKYCLINYESIMLKKRPRK